MIDYKLLKETIDKLPNDKIILLGGHQNTDYDSIGSVYALTLFLNKIGKKAFMLLEKKDISKLDWFGNTEFIISNIEINDNYNFILLDSNRKNRLGVFENYFDNADITINIDHHENNSMEANYIFVDKDISSTSEIIFNLINLYNDILDKDIATLLYAGIASDTNSFYRRVTPNTMRVASELLKYNIDSTNIIKNVCKNITLEETKVLSDMLTNIKYSSFHYIVMDRNNPLYKDIDYNIIFKKLASIIYDIDEIKLIGLFLIELDGSISGLFRSNCEIDVDKLAISLGGGGHKKASGFENNMNIDDVLEKCKTYIKKQS